MNMECKCATVVGKDISFSNNNMWCSGLRIGFFGLQPRIVLGGGGGGGRGVRKKK